MNFSLLFDSNLCQNAERFFLLLVSLNANHVLQFISTNHSNITYVVETNLAPNLTRSLQLKQKVNHALCVVCTVISSK